MRIRVIPSTSIPAAELHLPKKKRPEARVPKRGSPTAASLVTAAVAQARPLPPNLRLEHYVPPKVLYEGIARDDRELVSGVAALAVCLLTLVP